MTAEGLDGFEFAGGSRNLRHGRIGRYAGPRSWL